MPGERALSDRARALQPHAIAMAAAAAEELSRLVDRIVQLASLLDPSDLEAAADQILSARSLSGMPSFSKLSLDESETAVLQNDLPWTGTPSAASKPAAPKPAASKPAAPKPAAPEAHSAAADTLEAWLRRQPEQKVLLVGMGQFYHQYAAAGQTVKHRGIRPFAADHGPRFLVSGKGKAMAICATSSHRAGGEERRHDRDGELYTKVEFIGEYGGVLEWEQAERDLRVDDQTAPTFASNANIRRFHGTLMDEAFVLEALESAGYRVERAVHKQGTDQSHGRWEVRGADFEVHPSYRLTSIQAPPAPLVDTIVQGTKGWKEGVLNAVAEALENAVVKAFVNGGDSGAAKGKGKGRVVKGSKTRDARAAFERPQPGTPPHQEPQARAAFTPEARKALKAELRKVNVSKDSYVEPELRGCDAQGFMAAGALLWCQTTVRGNVGGIHILMAEEQRKPGQPTLINFIGGKRDALGESARQTAAREVTEETGELISEATQAAILAAGGPVLWDSHGKYATFIVEVAPEDADLPRRLEERGGPPDPWDMTLKGVKWVKLDDVLSDTWCKAAMAKHHQRPVRLLWPHLRALYFRDVRRKGDAF